MKSSTMSPPPPPPVPQLNGSNKKYLDYLYLELNDNFSNFSPPTTTTSRNIIKPKCIYIIQGNLTVKFQLSNEIHNSIFYIFYTNPIIILLLQYLFGE